MELPCGENFVIPTSTFFDGQTGGRTGDSVRALSYAICCRALMMFLLVLSEKHRLYMEL